MQINTALYFKLRTQLSGSVRKEFLCQNLSLIHIYGTTVERYNKGFEAVQALSQGKIDAVVIDGEPAKTFVSESEGLKILDEAFTVEEYAIAVKKGNSELLDKINTALESLKDNGTLDEIVAKYIKAE